MSSTNRGAERNERGMSPRIYVGDSSIILPTLDAESFDACVTDPPYHLTSGKKGGSGEASVNINSPAGRSRITTGGFMGKKWDGGDIAFQPAFWAEVIRVLKPGAHLVAFGGTRTYHRMVCAIEDAGFEIRDQLGWAYGSGFPKSSNQESEWAGWGTALKPAREPRCLARKPLIGTVAANLAAHRTGALNIDACRVGFASDVDREVAHENALGPVERSKTTKAIFEGGRQNGGFPDTHSPTGRWPANLVHDGSDEVIAAFPESDGQQGDLSGGEDSGGNIFGKFGPRRAFDVRGDGGSASRFFYCAKASQKDRDAGIEFFELSKVNDGRDTPIDNAYQRGETLRKNTHPTVKPTDLMRWLCRLVTPPGGRIIDPFLGSGSTGRGAVLEGFEFTGIERETEYAPIARARIQEAVGALLGSVEFVA